MSALFENESVPDAEQESGFGEEEEETTAVAQTRGHSFEGEGSLTPSGSGKEGIDDLNVNTVTPEPIPVPTQPPWLEWSDDFINEEKWESDGNQEYFEDNFTAADLLRIKAFRWMRPVDVFREPPTVVKFNSLTLDLITPNANLCEKSEVLRYILGEISELYDYSMQNKFECEGEGVTYVPNYPEDDRRWTPWGHIYSCCKAGVRGEKPVYNPKGKYYVRLYFMGAWRRIVVDDRIPVLPNGRSGLPLTGLNELWPMILAKALLKVAIVTWSGGDVKRFSTISALTGWVFEWIDNIDGVNEEALWVDLENTLPKFKDPTRIPSWNALMQRSKKKKFGTLEGGDTFWWMPPLAAHPSDLGDSLDDIPFQDFEHESLEQIREIVRAPFSTDGEEFRQPIEYTWKRTADQKRRQSEPVIPEIQEDVQSSEKNAVEMVENTQAAEGVKKPKKGKEIVEPSERKSMGPKKFAKKQKEKELAEKNKQNSSHKDLAKNHKKDKAIKEKGEVDEKDKEKVVEELKPVKGVTIEEPTTTEEEAEEKAKPGFGPKNWFKIKNIVLGQEQVMGRKSRSVRKSLIAKSIRSDAGTPFLFEEAADPTPDVSVKTEAEAKLNISEKRVQKPSRKKSPARLPPNAKIPPISEILYGVQKYNGVDYRNVVKNWENICGKDSPIALIVVLKYFPKPEDDGIPQLPSFLQHPIQLTEVRDTYLPKLSDRPATPLWKRFRWKAWAMRKGLIPMEEDHSRDIIHAIKAKTPFVFKNDWYEFVESESQNFEEIPGEDDTFVDTRFFYSFKSNTTPGVGVVPSIAPAVPPVTHHFPAPNPFTISSARQSKAETVAVESSTVESNTPVTTPLNMVPKSSHASGGSNKRKETLVRKTLNHPKHAKGAANQQQTTSPTTEKMSSTNEEKNEGGKGSQTMILHETQIVRGESDDDFDDGSKRVSHSESVVPTSACGTMWFSCDDIARNLRKFCKFYTSTSIFGSCYILRREPNVIPLVLDPAFQEIHSNIPKYPEVVMQYKQKSDCINSSIEFERWKSYHVTNYHLDDTQGIDSGFYMFSDCWTEQELIISVQILQEEFLKQYTAATTLQSEEMPVPPPTPNATSFSSSQNGADQRFEDNQRETRALNLNFIMEPWDWRKDCCLNQPLICTSIRDQWIAHVRLPAGRNTFRIWLMIQNSDSVKIPKRKSAERMELDDQNELLRRKNSIPFSVRIVSQTPIYVGSRIEVQNYMTNPPMLFLKQCERLANNLWGLFACFGKQRFAFQQNLKQLRRSYCPAYSEPNLINKFLRGTHDTFEELFVSLITQYNEGKLDRMLVLTLRVLFMNPMIGRQFVPKTNRTSIDKTMFDGIYKGLGRKAKGLVLNSTITIQRYYRGWRVRRLFHLRNKSHPDFRKIEYNVRKIAYLLARETDSVYSHPEEYMKNSPDEPYPRVKANMTVDPEKIPPTIMPNPPHWAADLLKYLTEHNPWLITIHPHAYCVPHHIKLQEIEGELPRRMKEFSWYPFFREVLKVSPDSKSCFCEIDLQVFPVAGIYMKIINNDNGKSLALVNNRLFLGRLAENKHGYTILCYRWAVSLSKQELNERSPSKLWKIRVVTPHTQEVPRFVSSNSQDGSNPKYGSDPEVEAKPVKFRTGNPGLNRSNSYYPSEDDIEFPRKLSLRQLTGYYLPNKDFSLCRYLFETEEKRCTISLRFRASYEKARIRVQVWDCAKRSLVFEETCDGGLIAPCIQLYLTRKRHSTGSLNEDWSRGDLVSSSGLLLNKKGENSPQTGEKSEPGTSSATNSNGHVKRRYIISIYIVDNSWPLTDREWVYVLYKKRKMFKDMRRWDYKDCIRRRQERAERKDVIAKIKAKSIVEEHTLSQLSEAVLHDGNMIPGDASLSPVVLQPLIPSESMEGKPKEKEPRDRDDFISTKRKKTRAAHTKDRKEKDADKDKDGGPSQPGETATVQPQDSSGAPQTAYPATPPPSTISNIDSPLFAEEKIVKKLKMKKRINGSLLIKYSGRQSQYVRHFDQPHWTLEILTDAKLKYKLKSNRQILRKRLLQAKESWEQAGFERLDRALCHRREYLLENLVPINYKVDHPFNIIDPMTNLYSCLHLEDYDLNGYTNREFINLLQNSWSIDQEEKRKAVDRQQKPKKYHHHGKIKPYGMDYLPRTLRRRVEKYRLIRAEAKEQERKMLKKQSLMEEDYEEEDGFWEEAIMEQAQAQPQTEVEITIALPDLQTSPVPTDGKSEKTAFIPKKFKNVANKVKTVANNLENSNSKKKLESDKEKDNKTVQRTPSSTKPKKMNKQEPPIMSTIGEKSSVVARPELRPASDNDNDEVWIRLKRCGALGEVLKRYEEFFKQPKSIREGLLDVIKRNHLEKSGSKKLVLTRSGLSKYCQKMFNRDERQSRETLVADKLLKWAFDYSCLQPSADEKRESIEDPGELPSFFIKSIIEDPKAEEELTNQQNDVRYPLPPPRRPTHVLIGPKIKDCGLDIVKRARKNEDDF